MHNTDSHMAARTCAGPEGQTGLVRDVYCIFVTFPCGNLGQVWNLIVSFSDLCHLSYFGTPSSLENNEAIGFLSNTCFDPLVKHKAAKSAFNVGPLSACQRNAILMAFRWREVGGSP